MLYCSKECQSAHWNSEHHASCSISEEDIATLSDRNCKLLSGSCEVLGLQPTVNLESFDLQSFTEEEPLSMGVDEQSFFLN